MGDGDKITQSQTKVKITPRFKKYLRLSQVLSLFLIRLSSKNLPSLPLKKNKGPRKKTNLMYDNQYEKYVKTHPFIVAGWDSAYFYTNLLLLGYIITENLLNLKRILT